MRLDVLDNGCIWGKESYVAGRGFEAAESSNVRGSEEKLYSL